MNFSQHIAQQRISQYWRAAIIAVAAISLGAAVALFLHGGEGDTTFYITMLLCVSVIFSYIGRENFMNWERTVTLMQKRDEVLVMLAREYPSPLNLMYLMLKAETRGLPLLAVLKETQNFRTLKAYKEYLRQAYNGRRENIAALDVTTLHSSDVQKCFADLKEIEGLPTWQETIQMPCNKKENTSTTLSDKDDALNRSALANVRN